MIHWQKKPLTGPSVVNLSTRVKGLGRTWRSTPTRNPMRFCLTVPCRRGTMRLKSGADTAARHVHAIIHRYVLQFVFSGLSVQRNTFILACRKGPRLCGWYVLQWMVPTGIWWLYCWKRSFPRFYSFFISAFERYIYIIQK